MAIELVEFEAKVLVPSETQHVVQNAGDEISVVSIVFSDDPGIFNIARNVRQRSALVFLEKKNVTVRAISTMF